MMRTLALGVAMLWSMAVTPAFADVTVNIGVPTPPPVVISPPSLVIVPGTPVHYVPTAHFNLFVYAGKSYSLHNGHWFIAASPKGPWTMIRADVVPAPVLSVPVKYYKVPPGHAKKMAKEHGGGHGHAKAKGHKKADH